MEAEIILLVNIGPAVLQLIHLLLFIFQVLYDTQRVHVLELLLIYVLYWIPFILHLVHKVHDLLLAHPQVVNVVLLLLTSLRQLTVFQYHFVQIIHELKLFG